MTDAVAKALLPVEQIDRDRAADLHIADCGSPVSPYDRRIEQDYRSGVNDDWNDVQAFAAHRLQAPAEAGEEVERVAIALAAADGLDWNETCALECPHQPDVDFCDSSTCVGRMVEDHDPDIARELYLRYARAAITALRANAPEAGEVERVLALVPNAYADIKLNLPDAVICYGMDTGGCVREAGCEDTCLMLATYRKGVEFGARAALASGAGDELGAPGVR